MGGHNGTITKYGYKTGNSLRMWRDYFINANIHGIDIYKEAMIYDEDRLPFDQWIVFEDGVEVMPRQTADKVANLIYTLSQYSTKKI